MPEPVEPSGEGGASPGPRPASRITVIDGLRGLSILLVVLFHYTYIYSNKYSLDGPLPLQLSWGGVGVSIFFVVSGLVIMKSLENSTPVKFLISRFARLYPAYLFCLVLTSLIIVLAGHWYAEISARRFLANVTMFQYYLGENNIDGVYWSLRVEIAFYAIIACLFFIGRRWFWPLMLLYAGIAVVANTIRLRVDLPELALIVPKVFVFEFIHLFIIGVVAYKLFFRKTAYQDPDWIRKFGLPLLALSFLNLLANEPLYVFATIAAVFAIMFWTGERPRGVLSIVMNSFPLQYLGRISYSLYLLHQVNGYILMRFLQNIGMPLAPAIVCSAIVIILVSDLVNRMVETDASNRLRARLSRGRRPVVRLP